MSVGVRDGKAVGGREVLVAVKGMRGVGVGIEGISTCVQAARNMHRIKDNLLFGVSQLAGESVRLCDLDEAIPLNRFAMSSTRDKSLKYTVRMDAIYKPYLHNPPHYFVPNAMYMVTGAILHKQDLLIEETRKQFLLQTLFERTQLLGWGLQAWAVLNNHYHFIAQAPKDATTLEKLIRQLHSITAIQINRWDNTPGRQVWFNYWDTCLTYEKSYLARLQYVHRNPEKHGLINDAINYPFCSYRWFVEQGDKELQEQVFSQPIDRVKIFDNF